MDLSIVIVNWKSFQFTKSCIASLHATMRDVDYEIIVVDNASEDCRSLLEIYPDIKLISSERNLGFAKANNLGVEHSSGKKLLFLNPDTVVLRDAIARMMLCLDSAVDVGVCGCRLLNGDGTVQMSCVQRFPTILNQLLDLDLLKRRWPRLPLWGTAVLFSEPAQRMHYVDIVSGACLMVKREIFEQVGCFSADCFMYAEEVDLCWKIRKAGWQVCYAGDAEVVHFGGQSTKKKSDAFADAILREAIFLFFRKFRGTAYAQLYRTAMLLSASARLITLSGVLLLASLPHRVGARDAALRAFRKWRNVAWWAAALRRAALP